MSDYLFDKEGEEDPEVAKLEQLLGAHAHHETMRPPVSRRERHRRIAEKTMAVGMSLAALAFIVVWLERVVGFVQDHGTATQVERGSPPLPPTPQPATACSPNGRGFAFATEGQAQCAGEAFTGSGVLPIGEWLETSGEVSAQLEVADIGDLTIYGDSRVRLVGTGPNEHRLELARGRVSAQVLAPPRLFVVDTPGASAVDLGCAYELAVDAEGRTHLQVTTGAVSLEGNGLVAYVVAGSEVFAVPGRGPGTPIAIDAAKPLRDAAARFDGGDPTALPDLLAVADQRDTITLWNLLDRTEGEARHAVYRRLDSIHKHPSSVRKRDILDGQPAALEAWRESLEGQ